MITEIVSSNLFILAAVGLTVVVGMASQSFMAVGVVVTLIGMTIYLANLLEGPGIPTSFDLATLPSTVQGVFGKSTTSSPSSLQEVFYVEGNKYTYDEAPEVCAVYNSELATYSQVADAFSQGAEWCGYGWTMGGMALYPTQEDSWNKRQQELDLTKRTKCGRPGVNGGYFDPNTKFGVNCYGIKPNCNNKKYPIPLTDGVESDKLKQLRANSGAIKMSPFNRFEWSIWG